MSIRKFTAIYRSYKKAIEAFSKEEAIKIAMKSKDYKNFCCIEED